jgi:hypothetical protein
MRVIIAGNRDFSDYSKLYEFIDSCPWKDQITTILSGNARGTDFLGERYAINNGLKLELYPADWSKGKHAGLLRNIKMADNADGLIAIHINNSKGTKHMIEQATIRNLKLWILTI